MDMFIYLIIISLVAIMIFTFMFAIYNVAMYFRTPKEVRQAWYRARARFYFGIFLIAFSINQIIQFPETLTYIICFLLIVFGLMNINYGMKAMKYFESHFAEEDRAWEELKRKKGSA